MCVRACVHVCMRACVRMCVMLFMTFSVNKLTGCFLHVCQLIDFSHIGICGIQSSKYFTNTTNMHVCVCEACIAFSYYSNKNEENFVILQVIGII